MLINGAILATVLATEFGSGSKVSREKELSVFVSRKEIRKGAQLVNSIAHYKVGLPFDASFLKRKIVKSEYMEIDLPESPKRGAAGREEDVL